MSTTRGIFENFPNQPATRQDSPFAVVPEAAALAASSPFTAVARQDSPFTVVDEPPVLKSADGGQVTKLPERRVSDSPFQVAEPSEGFGYEAPAKGYSAAPFETPPAAEPAATSPFSLAPQQPAVSPFSVEPSRVASPSTQAAIAAFGSWQEPAATPAAQPFSDPTPVFSNPVAAPAIETPGVPTAFAPVTPSAPVANDSFDASHSDSFSIRQLELRAIFGVDREMNVEEILQRSRALPGIRNIARVSQQDIGALETLKSLLPNLGFGGGGLKLYSGSVPLEFIREGAVMLAVQTDGGFAPGVRETLMLVARELGRLT
ncbi:MAG: hypothetical protein ACRCXD_17350 [Luteolibacter sp.]